MINEDDKISYLTHKDICESLCTYRHCVKVPKEIGDLPYPPNYTQPLPHIHHSLHPNISKREKRYGSWWRYLEVFYSFAGEKPGMALDIGSGWGTTFHFLKNLGFDIKALDITNPSKIDKESFVFRDLNETSPLPFSDGKFDAIICMEVIEHIQRPFDLISEINRLLRPGGMAVLTTPNILSLRSRFNFMRNGIHDYFEWSVNGNQVVARGDVGGHITPIDFFQLSWMVQRFGLEIEEVKAGSESRPKGLKGFLFKIIEVLSKLNQNNYPSVLESGSGIILKIRKPLEINRDKT